MISFIIRRIVFIILTVFQYMFLFRAIISWIPQMQSSKLNQVLYQFTEPLIAPFRNLLWKIPALRMMPIDLSFLIAYFALLIVKDVIYYVL